jgi:hypothetical protein
MTDLGQVAGARPIGPPLRIGLPAIILCVVAFAYAWLAVPLTLVPHEGLLNRLGTPTGNDFLAFYSAALSSWAPAATDIYDLSRLFPLEDSVSGTSIHLPFPYPPSILLYVAPLAAMNYLPALYFWIGATTAPFVLIVRKMSGLAAPVILLAPPLVQNAIDGQNGALTASLFAGGLVLLGNRRPLLAGVLFGLLSYKPQAFILIPICLLAAREYRALTSLFLTCCCLLLASILAFGIAIWWKFIAFMPQQLAFVLDGRLPVTRCATMFLLVFHATGSLALANIAQAGATLAAWALVGWTWRRTDAIFPRALAFCVAMPLSTPYMFEYDLAVWTLPAAILLGRLWRGEGRLLDWASLSLLWLLPPLIWFTSSAAQHLSALALLPLAAYAISTVKRETASTLRQINAC